MREDEEIDFHLDMLTKDLIAAGMSAEDARKEALRRFGDPQTVTRSLESHRRSRRMTVVVLSTLGLSMAMQRLLWFAPWYRHLYASFPFYVPESLKNALEICACIAALYATGERRIRKALAIDRRVVAGMAFGIGCTLPMLAGFALTRSSAVPDVRAVLYLAFLSPLVEETVTRGFAFRGLRRAGWPLWSAAAGCAMVTGLAHVEKGQTAASILGLFLFTGLGGATFCWLTERWQSIWFPFALHAMMNLWWETFNVAPTALGGWYPAVLQNGSILLAILITHKLTPSPRRLDSTRQAGAMQPPPILKSRLAGAFDSFIGG